MAKKEKKTTADAVRRILAPSRPIRVRSTPAPPAPRAAAPALSVPQEPMPPAASEILRLSRLLAYTDNERAVLALVGKLREAVIAYDAGA